MARVGTCPFCAATSIPLTDEHVCPESWYPDNTPRSSILIVPACEPCNSAHDKIEKRLFLPFMTMLPEDPRTAPIFERAIRSAEESAAKNEREAKHRKAKAEWFLRRSSLVGRGDELDAPWTPLGRPVADWITEAGLHVTGSMAFEIGWENVEAIGIKFLRGAYFHETGSPLRQDRPIRVRTFTTDPRPTIEQLQQTPGSVTRGQFPFWYSMLGDQKGWVLAIFVLWDFLAISATNVREKS